MRRLIFGLALAVCGFIMPQASANFGLGGGNGCCPPECSPCCYESGFDGFYFGGNLGVVSHTAHRNDFDGFFTDNSGWTTIDTSFEAGLQLGYDWQCCNKLLGFVVDWNWADNDRRVRDNPNVGDLGSFRNRHRWFTTLRARAGVVVCDALVYVTGGAAVSRFNVNYSDGIANDFRHNRSRWGWTGGVGTEFKVWCNWSLGAEVLFVHFKEHNRRFTNTGGTNFLFGASDSVWLGRVLLNYRFGDLFACCR